MLAGVVWCWIITNLWQPVGIPLGVAAPAAGLLSWLIRRSAGWPLRGTTAVVVLVCCLTCLGSAYAGASRWYLRALGSQAQGTLLQPRWVVGERYGDRTVCRVALPDGSHRDAVPGGTGCAGLAGRRVTVVYDPAGITRPALGARADLRVRYTGWAAGASLLLLLGCAAAHAARRRIVPAAGQRHLS
ncbi:hypothetical protein [Streptomyces tropicalis]|uniref:DUF3592 domain-containing protein n=1 Tax=Streptomyces tropicalis TaxID=3034234 RepID=A0ABT6A484_9ACTN|nr:hypothetical protein [Streptomyces tropicalis]MDF3299444.1 hypothetical protein [Streptomyces tropicalis]